jgi:streptogramin lyase
MTMRRAPGLFSGYFARSPSPAGRLARLTLAAAAVLVAVPLASPAYAAAGTTTEYSLGTANAFPGAITKGPDNNFWFVEAGKIGRITPAGVITEFALPAGHSAKSITVGPDLNLWFTEPSNGMVGTMKVDGTLLHEYLLPGNRGYGTAVSRPQQITKGPDDKLWFTQTIFSRSLARTVGGQIDRMDTSGALLDQFPLPSGNTKSTTTVPDGITAGPDKNLWFADTQQGRIYSITTGGTLSQPIQVPHGSPAAIAFGPDGNLWLTANFFGAGGSRVDRMTIAGAFTEVSVPADSTTNGDSVGAITAGPDGNMWFTNYDMFSSMGSIWRAPINMTPSSKPRRFAFSYSKEIDGLTAGAGVVWYTTTDNSTGQSAIGKITTS